MPNQSIWFDQVPDQLRYPKLAQAASADVVVVGAGLAGVLTAYRLVQAGKKVILLEQNHVATGDSGLTTAFISRVLDADIPKLVHHYGMHRMQAICAAYAESQQWLIDTIKTNNIDCDFTPLTSTYYGTPADWEVLQHLDAKATWIDGTKPAIQFADEGSFHIRKFIFGLLNTELGKQIRVYEETAVTQIETHPGKVLVTTSEGKVAAHQVIVTSGLPVGFPELHQFFEPYLTFVITAQYNTGHGLATGQYWDHDQPYHYWKTVGPNLVMVGGADRQASVVASGQKPHDLLADWTRNMLPGDATITHQWSGSLFETIDGLPYIMPHPEHAKQVFIACGFSGNGMVGSTLASKLLAGYVTHSAPAVAKEFTLYRAGQKLHPVKPWQWILRIVLVAIYLTALIMPAAIFFQGRGGVGFLQGLDAKTMSSLLFPLVGLYAFTLLWAQFVLGSAMWLWRQTFSWIETFHRTQGIFVLLFACLHPLMILYGYGSELYFSWSYVAPEMHLYLYLAYFQLTLLFCTVLTAILRKTKFVKKIWRYIHLANYALFTSVWIHSWFLGSDVRFSNLKYLWIAFAITAGISVGLRLYNRFRPGEKVVATGEWIKAATISQVQPGKAFLASIGSHQIALFNFNGKYYAINNLCSHANGPLCQGSVSGNTIECPWHGSQFDVTTGAVQTGPATRPQRPYPTKVEGEQILVQL